jgi:hypothetical protein
MKLNDTTRRFPNTMDEAFGENYYDLERQQRWEWMEAHKSDTAAQAEFWVYIALAFAAGFLVSHLWG